ncbi:MAG TPA: P-II family nitrogen regulator [Ancylobacter sp.]
MQIAQMQVAPMQNPCLIVTIVRKGWGDTVLKATMDAGAHGGTILFGRGIGRNEQQRVFGIQIEPEKEIILTIVPTNLKDTMLQEIVRAADLTMPGNGLAFIVPVEAVAGIVHLVEERPS